MIEGKTTSGFKYSIDEAIFQDWRMVTRLTKLKDLKEEDEEDSLSDFVNVICDIENIIFKDKGEAFEKHIMKVNDGTIPAKAVIQEILEILQSNKTTKNS